MNESGQHATNNLLSILTLWTIDIFTHIHNIKTYESIFNRTVVEVMPISNREARASSYGEAASSSKIKYDQYSIATKGYTGKRSTKL